MERLSFTGNKVDVFRDFLYFLQLGDVRPIHLFFII